jgi:HlyD family secretion protein
MQNLTDTPDNDITRALGLDQSGKGRRQWKRWLAWGALIGVLVLMALVLIRNNGKTATQYRTVGVTRGDLTVTVIATGNLAPTNEVEVGSELSGIIESVLVDYNDRVTAGQPLARLDPTKFEAVVMQSRAALASAQARHQQTLATLLQKEKGLQRFQRAHVLSGGKAPSAGELEAAEADLQRARADVAAATAAIAQARATLKVDETNLSKTVIYSPINGIVLLRNVDPGQTVAASLQAPVLFILAEDLTRMELRVDVDEADVGQVKEGQDATFTVDAYPDRTFSAHLTQVRYGSQITDGVVTYTTLLNVDNPDLLLRPGMTATAEIVVQKIEDAVLAPNAALRFRPAQEAPRRQVSRRGVMGMIMPRPPASARQAGMSPDPWTRQQRLWIVKDRQAVPIAVSTGPTDGAATVITSGGIEPGTAVIVDAIALK